jgi:ABC-2 type transport system ATP-binding protein
LVESGVSVTQMYRKMPVLEDLFLELTGGDSIE